MCTLNEWPTCTHRRALHLYMSCGELYIRRTSTSCSIPQLSSWWYIAPVVLLLRLPFVFPWFNMVILWPHMNLFLFLLLTSFAHIYLLLTRYYFSSVFPPWLDKFAFTKMTAKSGLKIFLLHTKYVSTFFFGNLFFGLKFLCAARSWLRSFGFSS